MARSRSSVAVLFLFALAVTGSAQDPGSRPTTRVSAPPCTVTGVVRDPAGAPVKTPLVRLCRLRCEGVPAEALRLEEQEWVEHLTTTGDEQGRYAFPVALGRLYAVWASAGGQASALQAPVIAGDRIDPVLASPVTVRGQVSTADRGGRRRIAPGVVVAARLPVAAARPLASGRGWLFPGPWIEGRADEQGRFALPLPPSAPGVPITLEARAGERRVRDVLVDVGQTSELVLPAARRPLRLRFLDRERNPVAGVRIVSDWAGGPEATSGSNGIAEVFDGLNALLRALPEEHAMRGLRGHPGPTDPPDYFVDVPLGEAVPLIGRLKDEQGKPLAGVRMCFVSRLAEMSGEWARFTTTDGDGAFTAPGLSRSRPVRAFVERDGRFAPLFAAMVERELDVGVCTVVAESRMLGRVTGPGEPGVPAAELLVMPEIEALTDAVGRRPWRPTAAPIWFPVGQDGTFCVANLPAGVCHVAVLAPGLCTEFRQLVVDGRPLLLDLDLEAGVSLTGTVLRHDGTPADFATVTARQTQQEMAYHRLFGLPAPSAVTDPRTGKFELLGVRQGPERTLEAVRLPQEHAHQDTHGRPAVVELRLSDPALSPRGGRR